MPRYIRWLLAVTSGITAQFAFAIMAGAIAYGTGNKTVNLNSGIGLLLTLGSSMVSILAALAMNDWIAKRYPPEPKLARALDDSVSERL